MRIDVGTLNVPLEKSSEVSKSHQKDGWGRVYRDRVWSCFEQISQDLPIAPMISPITTLATPLQPNCVLTYV